MNKLHALFFIGIQCFLIACSPIKTAVSNQYKLSSFSHKQFTKLPAKYSILVTTPDAVVGYQTEQIPYIKKPFELNYFANNAWVSPPAAMLFPLIVQSLQKSGYFYAVASSPQGDKADYRLDTQLIELQQNFLNKSSVLDMVVKVSLIHVSDNRIIASKMISQHIPCPSDTPYGGVIAANRAATNLTAQLTDFVVTHVRQESEN